MSVPVKMPAQGDIMESVIAKGDLAKLTPEERVRYYNEVCRSMGLNPLTQPFSYITLNGKLTLYATRACADQLRKVNGVSLQIVSREIADDILTVHVRATLPDGRVDEDLGSVSFPSTLKGEARANAELKGVTKAKRRATLSICGLGWLDETEIADIPPSAKRPAPAAMNVMVPAHDQETGEVIENPVETESEELTAAEWDLKLADAAKLGKVELRKTYAQIPKALRPELQTALDNRHLPAAEEADTRAA
jgi:hypothetical protein